MLADAVPTASSWAGQYTSLVQSIGLLGVLIVAIFTGYKRLWQFRWVADQQLDMVKMQTDLQKERAERAEAELTRIRTVYEDKVLPALESSNRLQETAFSQLSSLQNDFVTAREKTAELIAEAKSKGLRR